MADNGGAEKVSASLSEFAHTQAMGRTAFLVVAWLLAAPPAAAQEVPLTVPVNAGPFIMGSDRAERDEAYRLDAVALGGKPGRQRYENEPRHEVATGFYEITVMPITNRQYMDFVAATGHPAPDVDAEAWHETNPSLPYKRTRRHAWIGGQAPKGRLDHPVVLVSLADARAYARWLSRVTGRQWRLPTEAEWEKAARGEFGARFPWGNWFDPRLLNSLDRGPADTTPVGRLTDGMSPFGLLDAAGQVLEWTETEAPGAAGHHIVKGGAWNDKGCGACRPAARGARPAGLKHIDVGFRLVRLSR